MAEPRIIGRAVAVSCGVLGLVAGLFLGLALVAGAVVFALAR